MTRQERKELISVIKDRYNALRHKREIEYYLQDYYLDSSLVKLYCMQKQYAEAGGKHNKHIHSLKSTLAHFKSIMENYYNEA